jgi:hypothetical protein
MLGEPVRCDQHWLRVSVLCHLSSSVSLYNLK